MKKYFTNEEIEKGIIVNGIEIIPPMTKITLRNARQKRQLKYTKIGGECRYTIEWIEDYIDRCIVEVKVN